MVIGSEHHAQELTTADTTATLTALSFTGIAATWAHGVTLDVTWDHTWDHGVTQAVAWAHIWAHGVTQALTWSHGVRLVVIQTQGITLAVTWAHEVTLTVTWDHTWDHRVTLAVAWAHGVTLTVTWDHTWDHRVTLAVTWSHGVRLVVIQTQGITLAVTWAHGVTLTVTSCTHGVTGAQTTGCVVRVRSQEDVAVVRWRRWTNIEVRLETGSAWTTVTSSNLGPILHCGTGMITTTMWLSEFATDPMLSDVVKLVNHAAFTRPGVGHSASAWTRCLLRQTLSLLSTPGRRRSLMWFTLL